MKPWKAVLMGGVAFGLANLWSVQPAFAQQSEIDELRAQVRALMTRIDKLEKQKAEKKNVVSKPVASGSDKVKLSIKGQVNRAMMVADDGGETNIYHVDGDVSGTRVAFSGVAKPTKNVAVGAIIEVELQSNASNNISQTTENSGTGTANFSDRKAEVYFQHANLGAILIGQGSTASDGTTEKDISGTGLALTADFTSFGGGIQFRNSTTNALTGVSLSNVTDHFDGLSRNDRIRYDTPRFSGLQFRTSHVQGGSNDYALDFEGKLGAVELAAAAHYANRASTSTSVKDQYGGSISAKVAGVSVTVSGARQNLKSATRDDPTHLYGKLGYETKIWPVGKSAVSIDYGQSEDLAADNDKLTGWGFAAVQKVDDWGTEFYLGLRNYSLDRTGLTVDDIFITQAGARVKF